MHGNANTGNLPQMARKTAYVHKKNYIVKKSLLRSVEVQRMLSRKAMRIGLIAFMLVSSALFIFVPRPAEAGLVTFVETGISPDAEAVDVSPGSLGQLGFTGTIRVTNYNTATPLIVNLNAQSTVGQATLDKPQMVFQGGKQEDSFNVLVQVPIITTVRQPAQLSISGTWQQGGTSGTVGGSQAPFLVEQFYLMTVYSEMPVIETGPGTQAVFSIRVENTGNYRDEFRIEIANRDDLGEKGFIIPELSKKWVELGEPWITTLPVTLPHDWTIWTDHPEYVWLKVVSTSSGELVKEDYPLIIRVRGIYIPGFEPVFALMGIAFMAVILKRRHDSNI